MAIVWPCPLSVEQYLAAGRDVVVPRQECPGCTTPMSFWSGYERWIRDGGTCRKLWVRRAQCEPCQASHALLPSFCLLGRLDVVGVVGGVLDAVVGGQSGVRPAAALGHVPPTTARDWVRRFVCRSAVLAAGFAALVVALTGVAPVLEVEPGRRAMGAIRLSFRAARWLAGPALPGLWPFAALVTGGRLLATNTDPPWFVFGRRRFIPPVP